MLLVSGVQQQRLRFEGHRDITELVFSPDDKMTACKLLDMAILLWYVATGEKLHKLEYASDLGSQSAILTG